MTLLRASSKGLGMRRQRLDRARARVSLVSSTSLSPLQLELAYHGLQVEREAGKILARRRRLLGADRGFFYQLGNLLDVGIDLLGGAGLFGSRSRNLGDHSPYLL